jgi:hypothetical protein
MNRYKLYIGLVLTISLFSGCFNNQNNINTNYKYISDELQNAPKWVLNPKIEGYIADVGSAKKNRWDDINLQREEAISNARDNLAKQIRVKIDSSSKLFRKYTNTDDNSELNKSFKQISSQTVLEILKGSKVYDIWISTHGTLYVLMIVESNDIIH